MKNRAAFLVVGSLAAALGMSGSPALAQSSSLDSCISATDSGRYEQAVDECTDVIEYDDPSDIDLANAHFKRGLALKNLERYQEAIADYSQTIELVPDWFEAWVNRGNAYTWLGEYARGIEDYDHALELNPGDYVALENRGQAYANLRQHERAIEDYNESIEQNATYEVAYMDRGASYADMGELDLALQDLNKAIELSPDYMLAYGNRSNVLRNLGRYEEALRDFEKTRELEPDSKIGFFGLGQIYFEMGRFEEAVATFERASEIDPANPYNAVWHFLAMAFQQGDVAAARAQSRQLSDYLDGAAWPSPILRFLLGRADSESALDSAGNDDEMCEALFYVGMIDLVENDLENGRARLEEAAAGCPTDFVERYAARAELLRLYQQ